MTVFSHGRMLFRDRRGEQKAVSAVTATHAKNEFGRVLETAMHEGAVVITRHETPRAVLLSFDEFDALVQARQSELDTLSGEFDRLLEHMQAPSVRRGMRSAFAASDAELGEAAVAAARKRA